MVNSSSPDSNFGFRSFVGASWAIVRDHWFSLLIAQNLTALLTIIAGGLAFWVFVDSDWNIVIALTCGLLTGAALQAGFLRMCLTLCQTGRVEWRCLFTGWALAIPLILSTFWYWIAIAAGSILLIVPGLIASAVFSLSALALVDQGLLPLQSLAVSRRMVKGYFWYVVGFTLITWLGDCVIELVKLFCLKQFRGLAQVINLPNSAPVFALLWTICLCVLYTHIKSERAHE
jgi:hypothetical protein